MLKTSWNVKIKGQGLSVNEIFEKFWRERGIDNPEEFLSPDYYSIFPSNYLKNIDNAARVFLRNIQEHKNILVYADVDTDGCTSAAIIKGYIDRLNYESTVCINSGKVHGINFDTLEHYNFDLLIVVDSINDDASVYNELLSAGKEIIVLDHHIPHPDVEAIAEKINLVSSAIEYPNPNLSGSGVCWKFISYIDTIKNTNYADEFADLAATGIVADVCSLGADSMENRAICNIGFRMITNVGLKAILGKDTMTSTDVGFSVAPLINAANRMNENILALELFLTNSSVRAKEIIKQLTKLKEQQKKLTTDIVNRLQDQLLVQKHTSCYFLFVDEQCGNLSGLIATKISSTYHRPCLILHDTGTQYEGSMRAEGIDNFRKIINDSGFAECMGHENSAGITIPKTSFEQLKNYIYDKLKNCTFKTTENVDISLDRAQITPFILDKVKQINRISGAGFSPITFLVENVMNYALTRLSNGKHLCIKVPDMKFIKWNFMDWDQIPESDGNISFIGTLEESYFAGKKDITMFVEDYAVGTTKKKNDLW